MNGLSNPLDTAFSRLHTTFLLKKKALPVRLFIPILEKIEDKNTHVKTTRKVSS